MSNSLTPIDEDLTHHSITAKAVKMTFEYEAEDDGDIVITVSDGTAVPSSKAVKKGRGTVKVVTLISKPEAMARKSVTVTFTLGGAYHDSYV
jgi:hypothetical protein